MKHKDEDYTREEIYKYWDYMSNLLFSRVQHLIAVIGGLFTGWIYIGSIQNYDFKYALIRVLFCLFVLIICILFRILISRDISLLTQVETKCYTIKNIKSAVKVKHFKGRDIMRYFGDICVFTWVILIILSVYFDYSILLKCFIK